MPSGPLAFFVLILLSRDTVPLVWDRVYILVCGDRLELVAYDFCFSFVISYFSISRI